MHDPEYTKIEMRVELETTTQNENWRFESGGTEAGYEATEEEQRRIMLMHN